MIKILKPLYYKIILLTLKIEIYFVSNALFYNDEYLSEIFNSNEEEKFFSFVPRRINHFIYIFSIMHFRIYQGNMYMTKKQ